MSEPARSAPDPRLFAVLGAVAWVAFVTAVWGLLALGFGLEPISRPDAGPFLGPAIVAIAAVALGFLLVRVQTAKQGFGPAFLGCTAGVFLVLIVAGALGYALITLSPLQFLLFALDYAIGPFAVSAAVLAGLTGVAVLAAAHRGETGSRPRWPWERDDAE
jgi:hypothetical protein